MPGQSAWWEGPSDMPTDHNLAGQAAISPLTLLQMATSYFVAAKLVACACPSPPRLCTFVIPISPLMRLCLIAAWSTLP